MRTVQRESLLFVFVWFTGHLTFGFLSNPRFPVRSERQKCYAEEPTAPPGPMLDPYAQPPPGPPCVIKVIGVGGGGGNAVNRMIQTRIEGVSFWALNTDAQALSKSLAPNVLNIGRHLTRGLGAGGDPSVSTPCNTLVSLQKKVRGSLSFFKGWTRCK